MPKNRYARNKTITGILHVLFSLTSLILVILVPSFHVGHLIFFLPAGMISAEILGLMLIFMIPVSTGTRKKSSSRNLNQSNRTIHRTSKFRRSDDIILASRFEDMSGAEFERLLALYFRDQGYQVKEVGVGGNDGGVDLVITDRRGEKTAVQAKCYADHNKISVQIVRELVAAKRNHDCILSLLVTTSDLTEPAKKEAEQFKVDYWHGAVLEHKLMSWGKWNPSKKSKARIDPHSTSSQIRKSSSEVAVTKETTKCKCGASMVVRKNRQGKSFLGCSRFPACRHTKSL